MERSGFVVISEAKWRGWRAYVDRHPAKIVTANHAFLGVYVPAGRHKIRLVYLPQSFVIGRAISLGTLGMLVLMVVLRLKRATPAGADDEKARQPN